PAADPVWAGDSMPSAAPSDASDRLSWTRLPGGTFARHVMTLASGTAVGQVLLVLSLPVLTRLYSPADYGALAGYASTLTVLLVMASLRFELAIPLPEDDRVAGSLLALSLLSLAAMTGLVGVLVWLAGDALVARAKVPALEPYLWLIPIGLAGAGIFQALSY